MFKLLVALLILVGLTEAKAEVIFSGCPVQPTAKAGANIDRFRPNDYRLQLRSYSADLNQLTGYLEWFLKRGHSKPGAVSAGLQETGHWIEDVQLIEELSRVGTDCHVKDHLDTTLPLAIFPFVMRLKADNGETNYRLRYKLCEYYVDEHRQIPFENACTVLGREAGYTFAQLERRFASLRDRVEETRQVLRYSAYGLGLLASLTTLRFLNAFRVGAIPALGLGLIPSATVYLAVQNGFSDEFVRNAVDFKDAAEVAVDGDLTTSVSLAIPIQDFTPYFVRYLDSIDAR